MTNIQQIVHILEAHLRKLTNILENLEFLLAEDINKWIGFITEKKKTKQ